MDIKIYTPSNNETGLLNRDMFYRNEYAYFFLQVLKDQLKKVNPYIIIRDEHSGLEAKVYQKPNGEGYTVEETLASVYPGWFANRIQKILAEGSKLRS